MTGSTTAPVPAYRPDIDGLRALAVSSVVVYHAFPQALGGGFVGVDIFFVISGYLISTIVFGQLDAGRFSFADFYARRIRRIFPAVILVLVACLAVGAATMLPDAYRELGRHTAAGMGFVSNLLLWSEAGYFDAAAHAKPLLHLWSLGIEEQFYIAWPLLAWAAYRRRHGLLVLVLAVLAGSFVLNVAGIGTDPVATFYSPLSRAWELAAGGLLAWATLHGRLGPARVHGAVAEGLSLGGAALLAAALALTRGTDPFPGWWALLPVAGTAAMIAAGPGAWLNRRLLANPVAVWIGLISYPLYLWHWPALFAARHVDAIDPAAARVAAVVAAVVLAALTYLVVERKVRHRRGRATVAALVIAGALVAAAGLAIVARDGLPQRAVATRSGMTEAVAAQFTGPKWKYMANDACRARYPYPAAEATGWWFCIASSPAPPTLAILGNSFANQYYPGFVTNPALAHHTILSIGNCDVVRREPGDPVRDPICYGPAAGEGEDYLARLVRETPSLRFVVLAGLPWHPEKGFARKLRARIAMLERRGIRVIAFAPHLRIPFDPRTCFETPGSAEQCRFDAEARLQLDDAFRPLRAVIGRHHPSVPVYDPNGLFCDGARCSYVRDGLPLHRDPAGHLSEYAAVALQEDFTAWARTHVPELLAPAE